MRIEIRVSEEDGYTQVFVYRGEDDRPAVLVYAHPAPERDEWALSTWQDEGVGWNDGDEETRLVRGVSRDEMIALAAAEAVALYRGTKVAPTWAEIHDKIKTAVEDAFEANGLPRRYAFGCADEETK